LSLRSNRKRRIIFSMIELTDQNFEKEVINNPKPVLVDFYTSWCPPCKTLSPILEKLSDEFKEEIIFTKINIDSNPVVSQQFGIESIPTVALFKNGKSLDGFVGALPEPTIREWLEKNLNFLKSNKEKSAADPARASVSGNDQKIEDLIKEYQALAEERGIKINSDKEILRSLMKGLLINEEKYGAKYCPCRRVSGKKEEDSSKICPCEFLEKEINEKGQCLCGLFVK
jgi:thioredoxin